MSSAKAVESRTTGTKPNPDHPYFPLPSKTTTPPSIKKSLTIVYSDTEHQEIDFHGIHEKTCSLLIPLRTPVVVLGSEEERTQREKETRQQRSKLLEISKLEAHKKLFEGQVSENPTRV